jgi:hypothetical protein
MLISSRAILRVAASAAARWLQEQRRRQAQRLWLPQQVAGLCFSLQPLVRQWRARAW